MARQRLSELCRVLVENRFSVRLEGEDHFVSSVNTLESAGNGEITFFANEKYAASVRATKASAIILRENVPVPDGVSAIRCDDPYGAVTIIMVTLHGHRKHPQWGLSLSAVVDQSAILGKNPNVANGVTIAAGVEIGDNCTIYPGCYIGPGVRMGNDCTLFPNVVIYDLCELGNRVTIHAGSVIGEDGIGYAPRDGGWIKIPQIGTAVVGDDVEIGANCTIDRATLGETIIGAGSKLGNVVVIGHGSKLGKDCLFAGLVGIAGSAKIGRHVTLGGQVGVAGHLSVGDDVRVAGQSGVQSNVPANATLLGSPARDARRARRSMVAVRQLPDWIRRIRELERELQELRERVRSNGGA